LENAKENIIKEKSYKFALRIIKLFRYLRDEKSEFVLSKQILRCGTSIGANVEEAIGGQTMRDFRSKLMVAYKEARETKYWLNLLKDSDILEEKIADSMIKDCDELIKITGKIVSTVKTKIETE
jgi:four helix bundle protein